LLAQLGALLISRTGRSVRESCDAALEPRKRGLFESGGDRGPRTRRLAALTVAEVRRLFNLIGLTRIAIYQGPGWTDEVQLPPRQRSELKVEGYLMFWSAAENMRHPSGW